MFSTRKPQFANNGPNLTKDEKGHWYWGINNNTNTHCYLLEMVIESLNNNDSARPYKRFIRKNITNICLEVGNMSDFFEQLNYIIISSRSKSSKIRNIMNLRDDTGKKFINEQIAEIIYNSMMMNYVKTSMIQKYGGASQDEDENEDNPDNQISDDQSLDQNITENSNINQEFDPSLDPSTDPSLDPSTDPSLDPSTDPSTNSSNYISSNQYSNSNQYPNSNNNTNNNTNNSNNLRNVNDDNDSTNCYRIMSKGKIGYSIDKCSSSDPEACQGKVPGCEKKLNCSIEDPNNPGRYRNISDMKNDLYQAYQIADTKKTSVLKGRCLSKKDTADFKLATFSEECNLNDLNELCNYYESNPDEIDGFLKDTQHQYQNSNMSNCRQMLGDYNKIMKGKSRNKTCKSVTKEIDKKATKEDRDKRKKSIVDKFDSLKDKTKMGLSNLSDKASSKMANMKDKMGDMKDNMADMKDNMGDMKSNMKDKLANMKDNMADISTDDLKDQFSDFSDNLSELNESPMIQGLENGLKSLGEKLGDQLTAFNEKAQEASSEAIESLKNNDSLDENVQQCLPNLPKLVFPSVLSEFNIPLNINDVLLIGFSVFPYIGWIFDIFMIFRALLERRWLYAILMTINWYQWFFWKILTFGTANVDIGPLFKLFYMGPYASKYFNISNVAVSFLHFINQLTGNMPTMLTISN